MRNPILFILHDDNSRRTMTSSEKNDEGSFADFLPIGILAIANRDLFYVATH